MRILRESRLKEAFKGWDANRTYALEDGSKWKLVKNHFQYKELYKPRAKVLAEGKKLFLEIEGMEKAEQVMQIF